MINIPKFYDIHRESFPEKYAEWESFFRKAPWRIKALKIFGKLSTGAVYIAYILLTAYVIMSDISLLLRTVTVPGAIFTVTTLVRKGINAPRPYEYGGSPITPLVPKSTKGNSCPSRHTACAFAIALAALYVNTPAGIALTILAALIGISRPVMGVHYPFDVVFGAAIALAIGIIGFWIIP